MEVAMNIQLWNQLSQYETFRSAQTPRERCYWACEILRVGDSPISFKCIGDLLGVDKGSVRRWWRKFKDVGNEKQSPGRHTVLDPEEHECIVSEILERFQNKRPITVWEICRIIQDRWDKVMIPDTFYRIMQRDGRVKTCCAQPIEDVRLQVTDEDILSYFGKLYQYVSGIPAHFVLNMDEMGHQPFADAKDIVCFVPSWHEESSVRYPVSRIGKRVTLIGCICADGSHLRPCLIIPRQTFDEHRLAQGGYSSDKVEIYTQKKGYIDRDIFEDWVKDTLVPEIQSRREKFNYWGPAVLILDNCSAHDSQLFRDLCIEKNIHCLWLPPHSSHLLQMLDLCIFGVTKRVLARLNRGEHRYVQTDHLLKILDSFSEACAPGKIAASFRLGGVSLILDETDTLRCAVTPHKARRVLGLFEDPTLSFFSEHQEEEDEGDLD
jgi:hypothetical protein